MRRIRLAAVTLSIIAATVWVSAQQSQSAHTNYLLPPKVIVDILDAPPPPTTDLSPTRDTLALIERASMPALSELAQPVLRLAGRRINPRTNGPHRAQVARAITLKSIADGSERKVTVPANPAITWIGFSRDGKRFAFTQQRENGIELWMGDTATGQAKALTPAQLNASLGAPCQFVADGGSLLCRRRSSPCSCGASRAKHSRESRRHRTRSYVSGPAHERIRRSVVRLLRDEPTGIRGRDQRPAHITRHTRRVRNRRSVPRRQLRVRQPHPTPLLVAGAVHELPVDG
jgi:hypothetical protein